MNQQNDPNQWEQWDQWDQQGQPDQNPPNRDGSQNWDELLAGHVLGDLSSEEMEAVQQYLVQHPQAQIDLEELQMALNLLPLSLPEEALPPEEVRSRLRQSARSKARVSRRRDRWQRWQNWSAGAEIIAAASVIAFLGVQNQQLRQELQLAQSQNELVLQAVMEQLSLAELERDRYQEMLAMLRLPNNRLLPLRGDGYLETSSGSLVIAPQKSWSVLTLKELPQPPAGKAYQLWAVVEERKVYCVEFLPDENGEVLVEIPVDEWGNTPMVAITVEDAGTIPDETSEMVMNSPAI